MVVANTNLFWAGGGRYVDRFERRQGVWKIAHHVVAYEWDSLEPAGAKVIAAVPFFIGLRSHATISFASVEGLLQKNALRMSILV
jgi:hypothetical protein